MVREINVKNREQVEKICKLACSTPYEVWLSAGTTIVDARSMLSLLMMVGKKAFVVADDDVNARSFAKLVHEME